MDDLIYNQRKIPKNKWRYGFRTSAATGCGWIATYNALRLMGYRAKPERLIHYYERQMPLINGNFGTFLPGVVFYFKRRGFRRKITVRRSEFDEIVKGSDVSIVFFYWRKKHKFGAHFVTVQYQDEKFIGYNTFSTSVGPDNYGESLDSFLRKNKFFCCVLIAIQDKRKERKKLC